MLKAGDSRSNCSGSSHRLTQNPYKVGGLVPPPRFENSRILNRPLSQRLGRLSFEKTLSLFTFEDSSIQIWGARFPEFLILPLKLQ